MDNCFPPQGQLEPRTLCPKYHPKVEMSTDAYVNGILRQKILSILNPLKNPKRSRYKRQGFRPAKVITLSFSNSHLASSPFISHFFCKVSTDSYIGGKIHRTISVILFLQVSQRPFKEEPHRYLPPRHLVS